MKNTTTQTEARNTETQDSELHELFLDELADILHAERHEVSRWLRLPQVPSPTSVRWFVPW